MASELKVVRYEAVASDPTAVWRIATVANHKADMVQQQRGDFQKSFNRLKESMNRVEASWHRMIEDLRRINPSSTQGVHLHGTPEGNHISLPTGYSVVPDCWGQSQLPHAFVATPTLNKLNTNSESELARQWDSNPRNDRAPSFFKSLAKGPILDSPEIVGGEPLVEAVVQKEESTMKSFTPGDCKYCRGKGFLEHKCKHDQQVNLMAGVSEDVVPEQGEIGIPSWLFGLSLPDAVDLAVLEMDSPTDLLKPVNVGQSSALRVGQQCLAMGNPFGCDHILTAGVISGLNRDIFSKAGVTIEDGAHFHMKQGAVLYNLEAQMLPKNHHCYFIRLMLEYFKFSSLDSYEFSACKPNNPKHSQLAEFNPLQFNAVYCSEGYNSYAVVSFTKDGIGFKNTLAFQNYLKSKCLGKMVWNETNQQGKHSYGWLPKEEDDKSGGSVDRFLSEIGDANHSGLVKSYNMPCNVESAPLEPKLGNKFVSGGTELVVRVWDPGSGSKSMNWGDPVMLNPEFVMCDTTLHLELLPTFSSEGLKTENLDWDSCENDEMMGLHWEISDIICIDCKGPLSVGSALITLLVGSGAKTGNSGSVRVQFCLTDLQWTRRQQKNWRPASRYQEIWNNIPSDDLASKTWSLIVICYPGDVETFVQHNLYPLLINGLIDREIAAVFFKHGKYGLAAKSYEGVCALYSAEGREELLAEVIPNLAECQKIFNVDPGYLASGVKLLSLKSGLFSYKERQAFQSKVVRLAHSETKPPVPPEVSSLITFARNQAPPIELCDGDPGTLSVAVWSGFPDDNALGSLNLRLLASSSAVESLKAIKSSYTRVLVPGRKITTFDIITSAVPSALFMNELQWIGLIVKPIDYSLKDGILHIDAGAGLKIDESQMIEIENYRSDGEHSGPSDASLTSSSVTDTGIVENIPTDNGKIKLPGLASDVTTVWFPVGTIYDTIARGASTAFPQKQRRTKRRRVEEQHQDRGTAMRPDEDAIAGSSKDVQVRVCPPHPGILGGLCFRCGKRQDEEDVSGVAFGYIHKGLKVDTSEVDRLRGADLKHLLRERKLVLILDLDHTLINSTELHDISAYENDLGIQTATSKDDPNRSLFTLESMQMLTKLRPFVHKSLEEASNRFEMYIYMKGDKAYAIAIAKLLDSDLPKRVECLKRLAKSDPLVLCTMEEFGFYAQNINPGFLIKYLRTSIVLRRRKCQNQLMSEESAIEEESEDTASICPGKLQLTVQISSCFFGGRSTPLLAHNKSWRSY